MTGATLFSGGELAGIGMMQAGLDMRWGIERDDAIASVARMNGHPVRTQDILHADPADYERVDCLHASPPCPNFSVAKTGGEETDLDRALADKVCAFIRAIRPRIFTLENVWGYRRSESWRRIRLCLQTEGYAWNAWHLNAADYSVPQTRKRMIVAGRLEGHRPRKPQPTHGKNPRAAGLFGDSLERWNGWYRAIEDLLPSCPDSQLAAWQLRRMPKEIKTLLLSSVNADGTTKPRTENEPAFSVQATAAKQMPRAVLVGAGGFRDEVVQAAPCDPAFAVTANSNQSHQLRAVLVSSHSVNGEHPATVDGQAPSLSVGKGAGRMRAVLIDGDNARKEGPIYTDSSAPCRTVNGSTRLRALLTHPRVRVVQLTPRCLMRFQSGPDTYRLPDSRSLACTIIGNGVSCLLQQKLYESLTR